jgi:hypothetical protein
MAPPPSNVRGREGFHPRLPLTDGDAARVDGAEVAVLKEVHQEVLSRLISWRGELRASKAVINVPRGSPPLTASAAMPLP